MVNAQTDRSPDHRTDMVILAAAKQKRIAYIAGERLRTI